MTISSDAISVCILAVLSEGDQRWVVFPNLCFLVAVSFRIAACTSLRAWLDFFACALFLIRSSYRQQIGVAWRENIVLDEPEPIIGKPATDGSLPMFFHELAKVIRVDFGSDFLGIMPRKSKLATNRGLMRVPESVSLR
jgi:hypothetical protein